MLLPKNSIGRFGVIGIPSLHIETKALLQLINDEIFEAFCQSVEYFEHGRYTLDDNITRRLVANTTRLAMMDAGLAAGASKIIVRAIPIDLNDKIIGLSYVISIWIHKHKSKPEFIRELDHYFS